MAILTTSYQQLGSSWIGSASGVNYYVNLYAKYSRTSTQQTNNKSTVYAKVTISCDKSSSAYSVWGTWIGTYTGLFGNSYSVKTTAQGGSEITLSEVSTEVSHTTNGTYSSSIGLTNADGPLSNSGATSIGAVSISLPTIPRYATSNQSLSSKTETTIKMNWSSDSTIDYIWYSTNGGTNWTAVGSVNATSGSYTISGLSANTTYSIKTRVRRKDSQLTTDSSVSSQTTYQYPYVSAVSVSNLSIGSKQTLTLYNPLSRSVTVYMKQGSTSGTQLYSGTTNSTSIAFTPTASTLYASIPNNTSGNAVYYCIYSNQNVGTKSGTYSIVANDCKPTFTNFEYSTNLSELTGNNDTIINGQTTTTFTISTSNKASAKNSASISKYRLECGSTTKELAYSSSASVSGTIENCTNQIVKITAIDSRGLETTVSKTTGTYLPYVKPSFSSVSTERKDGVDAETHLNFKANYWNGSFGNGNNSIVGLKYRTKTSSGSEWSSWYTGSISTISYYEDEASLSEYLIHSNGTSGGFAIGTAYDVQIQITDGLSTYILTTTTSGSINVTDGLVGISMYKDNDGQYHIGINGMPYENYTLNVDGSYKGDGNILVSRDVEANISAKYKSGNQVSLCSAVSGNHGIYSSKLNKWIAYADNSNVYLNGNSQNVTQKKTATSKTHTGYGTNNGYLPDISFLSYWNGAYNSSNSSNLTYCSGGTIENTTHTGRIGHFMCLTYSRHSQTFTAWSPTTVTGASTARSNGDSLTLSSNGVKAARACKVFVEAHICVKANASEDHALYIDKGSTTLDSAYVNSGEFGWKELTTTACVSLSSGDVLYLKYMSGNGGSREVLSAGLNVMVINT